MRALFVLTPAVLIAAPFMLLDRTASAFVGIAVVGLGLQVTRLRPERGER